MAKSSGKKGDCFEARILKMKGQTFFSGHNNNYCLKWELDKANLNSAATTRFFFHFSRKKYRHTNNKRVDAAVVNAESAAISFNGTTLWVVNFFYLGSHLFPNENFSFLFITIPESQVNNIGNF